MKKVLLSIVLLTGLTFSTQATMVDLGWTGGQPADVASEMNRLNEQIELYNAKYNLNLPAAIAPLWAGTQTEVNDDPLSITLNLNEFDGYLLFKSGPYDRLYYLNDNLQPRSSWDVPSVSYEGNGIYTFYNPLFAPSHYTTFSPVPVPETGTWAMGLAMFFPFFLRKLKGFKD